MQFVWGPRYVDDLILRDRDATGGGDLGKSSSGLEERLYALTDALFNVVALINTSGTVQERFLYDPYGKSKVLDANFSDDADGVSDYNWEYRFTGRRLDLDTGLQLNRNRYYHNALGRWINRDPIGYRGGDPNLYGYVGSMPTLLLDASGEKFWGCNPWGPWGGWGPWASILNNQAGVCTYKRARARKRTCYRCWISYTQWQHRFSPLVVCTIGGGICPPAYPGAWNLPFRIIRKQGACP